ncbi:hypothetical protein ykris0001_40410 [Yersinia kristensenii ATCC 33638]|nr:hypothetical protein ykris0001_40410 [Yersinia kristensenii ATCC 33638]
MAKVNIWPCQRKMALHLPLCISLKGVICQLMGYFRHQQL